MLAQELPQGLGTGEPRIRVSEAGARPSVSMRRRGARLWCSQAPVFGRC